MPVHLFRLRMNLASTGGSTKATPKGRGPSMRNLTPLPNTKFVLTGTTLDETGAAAAGFTVYLFKMVNGVPTLMDTTVSDGSGNYSFIVSSVDQYWATSYKSGSPDKAGATLQTLVGIQA
jgi:hypothetical protein